MASRTSCSTPKPARLGVRSRRTFPPITWRVSPTSVGAKPGDAVFFAAAHRRREAQELLGAARIEIAKRSGLIDESAWAFCWVIDAPMFEPALDDNGNQLGWTAVHHPFTSPNGDWIDNFESSPGEALAYAYDIVCNGNEIGGGSIRIHQGDVQRRVFTTLGISDAEAADKFGFLLDAFKFGPPPHGGIALGWDRVCMLLAGETSIREVIAFPKTRGGFDPLTQAPTPITAEQRREAGIDAKPKPAAGAVEPAPGHGVTLLVTGASGYLGRHLCRRALALGMPVVGTYTVAAARHSGRHVAPARRDVCYGRRLVGAVRWRPIR